MRWCAPCPLCLDVRGGWWVHSTYLSRPIMRPELAFDFTPETARGSGTLLGPQSYSMAPEPFLGFGALDWFRSRR